MLLTNEQKEYVRKKISEEFFATKRFQKPYKILTVEDEVLIERFKTETKNNLG